MNAHIGNLKAHSFVSCTMCSRTDHSKKRLHPLQVAMWAQLRSEVGRDNIEGGIETLRAQKMPPQE